MKKLVISLLFGLFSLSVLNQAMAASLQAEFDVAVMHSKSLPDKIDNETLLKLYSLQMQGSWGNVSTPRPPWNDFVGRAKWDAWYGIRGMPKVDAQKRYVLLVRSLMR